MSYKTIKLNVSDQIARLTLNRPETRNAFDEVMIREIHQAVEEAGSLDSVRALVLTGEGTAFSAGANIDWMRRMGEEDFEANHTDAIGLAHMLDALALCPKPTVARVNGPAIGGGTGLVAACDIAVGIESAFFSFSEVKIGLVPACIAPHVIRRVGEGRAGELFITGRRIDAAEAERIGLLNFITLIGELDEMVEGILNQIVTSGPEAVKSAKRLVRTVMKQGREEAINYTARLIAELRTSEEGREGTRAFLEKRKPGWVK
jgi:methylglutaconyl-CoA hydratase